MLLRKIFHFHMRLNPISCILRAVLTQNTVIENNNASHYLQWRRFNQPKLFSSVLDGCNHVEKDFELKLLVRR